jgi:polycomb protein EED
VKFYPYNPVGANPVFAAVSKKHVSVAAGSISSQGSPSSLCHANHGCNKAVICRLGQPKDKDNNPCEVIRIIRDDDVSVMMPCVVFMYLART